MKPFAAIDLTTNSLEFDVIGHNQRAVVVDLYDSNMKLVKRNQKLHNPNSPLLIGEVKDGDVVKEVNEPSYIETHEKVLPLRRTFQSTLL